MCTQLVISYVQLVRGVTFLFPDSSSVYGGSCSWFMIGKEGFLLFGIATNFRAGKVEECRKFGEFRPCKKRGGKRFYGEKNYKKNRRKEKRIKNEGKQTKGEDDKEWRKRVL